MLEDSTVDGLGGFLTLKSVVILSMMFLSSCANLNRSQRPNVNSEKLQSQGLPKIVNLGPEFKTFWERAKSQNFEAQMKIWDEVIEKPHQAFYDGLVWEKDSNREWQERKLRRLKEFFPKYQTLYPEIAKQFDSFERTLTDQVKRFQKFFDDAHFEAAIFAAPTTTFNGKGGEGDDSTDPLGKTFLAFGIDMIVDRKDNPDVLYAHELFHIYHTEKVRIDEKVFLGEGHITLPLWLEGLATYASARMNPQASTTDVLMDSKLAKLDEKAVRELAKKFLLVANEKAFDPHKPEIYKAWFTTDPQVTLGEGFPMRCGYLLGLKVAHHLSKKHELSEMVQWTVPQSHQIVLTALTELAR